MRRVKTMAELHHSGAEIEGLKFIEIKGKDHSTADLSAVLARIDRSSNTLEAALIHAHALEMDSSRR